MSKNAYVYFMANNHGTVLYIGVTSNLERRVWEHENHLNADCFTAKYNCCKLVYYECVSNMQSAIAREKQLKNWQREWKNKLIESINPTWKDLSLEW
jgi:putative endonuclease